MGISTPYTPYTVGNLLITCRRYIKLYIYIYIRIPIFPKFFFFALVPLHHGNFAVGSWSSLRRAPDLLCAHILFQGFSFLPVFPVNTPRGANLTHSLTSHNPALEKILPENFFSSSKASKNYFHLLPLQEVDFASRLLFVDQPCFRRLLLTNVRSWKDFIELRISSFRNFLPTFGLWARCGNSKN